MIRMPVFYIDLHEPNLLTTFFPFPSCESYRTKVETCLFPKYNSILIDRFTYRSIVFKREHRYIKTKFGSCSCNGKKKEFLFKLVKQCVDLVAIMTEDGHRTVMLSWMNSSMYNKSDWDLCRSAFERSLIEVDACRLRCYLFNAIIDIDMMGDIM